MFASLNLKRKNSKISQKSAELPNFSQPRKGEILPPLEDGGAATPLTAILNSLPGLTKGMGL